jgi:hypothetical protein
VVARKPDLGQVAKLPVFGDFTGRQVGMEVENGHVFRVVVKEAPRSFGLEKKFVADEVHKDSNVN